MFILSPKVQRSPEQEGSGIRTMLHGDKSGRNEKNRFVRAESKGANKKLLQFSFKGTYPIET